VNKYKIIILTGLSGSGKSTAVAALEDAGFFCVDNMPVTLLPKFLELPVQKDTGIKGLAFVMDVREKSFLESWQPVFDDLRQKGYQFEILFLEADETVLLKRFSQTRRHHPLAGDKTLLDGIRDEKKLLEPLKDSATRILDTSGYNIHDLKSVIFNIGRDQESSESSPMRLKITSFGFKYGTPHDADLIMDVRFLTNPYFVPELKAHNGQDGGVKAFVLNNATTRAFMNKFMELIDFLLPLYEKEGKAYLTIAVGCTGGRHRSVVIAGALADHIITSGRPVVIIHRDMDITI